MSQFPVENEAALYEGVNYLLSGPAGLGQNFSGFATYVPAYIRPTGRQPFTLPISTTVNPDWYIDIPISNIQPVNPDPITGETDTIEITFASAQPTAPFEFGDGVEIANVVEGSGESYNYDGYTVFSCSTTTLTIKTNSSYVWANYISGGDVLRYKSFSNTYVSTDCNARVTVYGPTDQVFLSCQLTLDFTYTCSVNSEFTVEVAINRYRGYLDPDSTTGDYLFVDPVLVSKQSHDFIVAGSGAESAGQNIFTTVLDSPSFGYYWYICEVKFITQTSDDPPVPFPGDAKPGSFTMGLRSLTAQVIKQ